MAKAQEYSSILNYVYFVTVSSTKLLCTFSYYLCTKIFILLIPLILNKKSPFFIHCFYYFTEIRAVKLQFQFLMELNILFSNE